MPQRKPGSSFITIGIIAVLIFGIGFLQSVFQRNDIWWTNQDMKLSLDQSRNQVEVYIREVKIDDVLDKKSLLLKSGFEIVELKNDDIKFRFNNRDKVKASQLPFVALSSSGCTAGIILLIYGFLLSRKKSE